MTQIGTKRSIILVVLIRNILVRLSAFILWFYVVGIGILVLFVISQSLSGFVPLILNPLVHVAVVGFGLELAFVLLLFWESIDGIRTFWKRIWKRYTPPDPRESEGITPLIVEGPYSKTSIFGLNTLSSYESEKEELMQYWHTVKQFGRYAFIIYIVGLIGGGLTIALILGLAEQVGLSFEQLTSAELPRWIDTLLGVVAVPVSPMVGITRALYPDSSPLIGYFSVTLYGTLAMTQTVTARNLIPIGEHINVQLYCRGPRWIKLTLVSLYSVCALFLLVVILLLIFN